MSQERIKEIMEDLFLIDPELKKYEAQIQKIIMQMIKEKPDTKLDKRFINRLKERLLSQDYDRFETKETFWMKIKEPAVVWASVATVLSFILLVTISINPTNKLNNTKTAVFPNNGVVDDNNSPVTQTVALFNKGVNITPAPANSFGVINSAYGSNASAGQESANSGVAYGMGGGGGIASVPMIANESAKMISDSRIMIPYTYYTFTYDGEPVEGLADKIDVYERVKSGQFKTVVAQKLKDFDFGFFDINKFSNLEVNNVDFSENRDYGYSVSISLAEESVSIYQNWLRWDNGNATYSPLKESDIPSKDAIVNIAKTFVSQYGIDTSPFGEPELNQYSYRVMYKTDDIATSYVPDSMGVIFPLSLDGHQVYEQSGQKVGLNVDVNIRYNRVSSANQIFNQNYKKSQYDAQTDWNKVLNAALNGGYPGERYIPEGDVKKVELKLDTPFKALVRTWSYDNNKGTSQELFTEALVFPIKDKPAEYYNDYIVVPLVKTWWDGIDDVVTPMPLAEPAAMAR